MIKIYKNYIIIKGDAVLTMAQLKEKLINGQSEMLMKRMSAYSANITGSDSYWYKRRK